MRAPGIPNPWESKNGPQGIKNAVIPKIPNFQGQGAGGSLHSEPRIPPPPGVMSETGNPGNLGNRGTHQWTV